MGVGKVPASIFILVILLVAWPHVPETRALPAVPPTLVGWGGSGLKHTDCMQVSSCNSTFPASVVFPGEKASVYEMQVRQAWSMGWNAVRASFDPYCTTGSGTYGIYNSTQFARAIKIAQYFDFWIVLDYHGYKDMQPSNLICWISFWTGVIRDFKDNYSRIVWEPLNEPDLGSYDTSTVTALSFSYQLWIDRARALGDNHWIVVQSLCSYECDFAGHHNDWSTLSEGYPTVTDPQGRVLMSVHPYFTYHDNWQWWSNSNADVKANAYYNSMVAEQAITGWPIFNTEGGAGGTGRGGPNKDQTCPDVAQLPNGTNLTGSAGYCRTTFHFAQTITNLLDEASPRMGYLWWVAASWTDTPSAGTYGALSPNNGWGTLLLFRTSKTVLTLAVYPIRIQRQRTLEDGNHTGSYKSYWEV